jgi:glutathione synthase/RimK-type ligase-like ATP-grasp enzyme
MVAAELERLGSAFACFNQRHFATARVTVEIAGGAVTGRLGQDGWGYALQDIGGAYVRLMDDQRLPELRDASPDSPLRSHARAVHDGLCRLLDLCPGRVVNRLAPMASNSSKPYQAQLIRELGFEVPATLITSAPDLVCAFRTAHGRVIFKSISGERSVVRMLEDADLKRLDRIRGCPVMFQEYVEGFDVRVHTIAGHVFAAAVHSDATDYRYAGQLGHADAELKSIELPDEIAERCLRLSAGLGLAFAGIDLRLTPAGGAVCFEVNPCPGYSYYEAHTGQPIARAVARHLAGLA